jgi:hypothetical protein
VAERLLGLGEDPIFLAMKFAPPSQPLTTVARVVLERCTGGKHGMTELPPATTTTG